MESTKLWIFLAFYTGVVYCQIYHPERPSYCNGNTLECKSLSEISELLEHYRSEATLAKNQLAETNCTVCSLYGQPCLNGGTCIPLNNYKFACQCPYNYTGNYCQYPVVCTTCGINAKCDVQNHRATCYCEPGYTGNPYTGCFMKKVTACATGDPHFRSYDKNYFDYQGTCPYIFTKNCQPISGYQDFVVKAKNKRVSSTAHVSHISEVEVNMRGITIHVDESRKLYINGIRAYYNYYYPSYQNKQVSVTYNFGEVTIKSQDQIEVVFKPWSLCVSIPDIPDFQGADVLCGLAGNRDNNCQNDLTMSNGTIIPSDQHSTSHCKEEDSPAVEWFGDTWITEDFLDTTGDTFCDQGHIVANRSINCNTEQVYNSCKILEQVENGEGPFKKCIGLGNETVVNLYNNCIYDLCYLDINRCDYLASFVSLCQSNLPFIDLEDWRQAAGCGPYVCPIHSTYSSCASSCQPTCSNSNPDNSCIDSCTEGCNCDPGYVVDTSADKFNCIPVESCGCTDSNSNYYPPGSSGLLSNCTQQWTCQNGTLNLTYHACGPNAQCNVDIGNMQCQCLPGYTGDGYNCVDINECLDPTVCSQNSSQGNCTNTPGSYYCTCQLFYDGNNCQYYQPKRHCADLYVYNNIKTTGAYNIYPPYTVNGRPPLTPLLVYCDMDTQEGGWTLLANSLLNSTSDKTYAQYVQGFGDPANLDAWLGLDVIHKMTNDTTETSLRVDLHRCARNGKGPLSTYCTYPNFAVLGPETQYSVFIPQECSGNETEFYDGWLRWNPDQVGPKFVAYDNDHSSAHCSQTFRKTGWWYFTDVRCGSANLNGNRYNCANPPDLTNINTYLQWGGSPLDAASMYLRPKAYPNYDHH